MMLLLALAALQDAPAAAPPAPAPVEEKKICRRPAAVGTRIPAKRVCRTAAEWKELDDVNAMEGINGLSGTQNRRN